MIIVLPTPSGTDIITTDPEFVDQTNHDFRLQDGSGCIDTGSDQSLTEDFYGMPIVGDPDIGIYEVQ